MKDENQEPRTTDVDEQEQTEEKGGRALSNIPLWASFDAALRRLLSSTKVRRQGESKHAKARMDRPGTRKERKKRKHLFRKRNKARRKQSWRKKAPK